MLAYNREQNIRFLTTMSMINAIISVGNSIVSALSESASPQGNGDALKKTIASLRELLLPTDHAETEKRAAAVSALLESEVAKGPIRVQPKVESHRQKQRGIRKQRE